LDLRDQSSVNTFFESEKPEFVFLAAAKVGGIHANNTYRGEFLYDNLMIQNNIIHASYVNEVKKLMFLGSSCIYPKMAPQPLQEDYLLTGTLEPTNEPLSVMPTNLYGPNDNYDLENSHVLPALIRKFHESKVANKKEVVMWGTGSPKREFLHVDDLADACYHLMLTYNEKGLVNIGTGEDISIYDVAVMIKDIVGFKGDISKDLTKPDGTPRKLMNVDKLKAAGWTANISLKDGLSRVYKALDNQDWF